MATFDFPADLIDLERAAWTEIQEGRLTADTALAVQTRITEWAAEHRHDRYEVEMALKRAVRHPEPTED